MARLEKLPLTVLLLLQCRLLPGEVRQAWIRQRESFASREWPAVLGLSRQGRLAVLARDPSGDSIVIQYDPDGTVVREIPLEFRARALAVDPAGGLSIAGGASVARVAATGERLWTAGFEGKGETHEVLAIQAGPEGVLATGRSTSLPESYFGITTIRYDALGNRIWAADVDPDDEDAAELMPAGLAVDPDGSVLVAGTAIRRASQRVEFALLTLKYGPGGNLIWRRAHRPSRDFPRLEVIGIELTRSMDILVAGSLPGSYVLIKLDPRGDLLWEAFNSVPGPGPFHALAVDGEGNAIVAGGEDGEYAAVKHGLDGAERWLAHHRVADSKFADNAATAVAIDHQGSIYLSGAGMDVVKFGPDGDLLWTRELDDQEDGHETTTAIAVGESGNVYLTGLSTGAAGTRSITIKITDPSLWRFRRGDGNGDGRVDPITDAIAILLSTLPGGEPIPCRAAADASGDGTAAGPEDAIYLLAWAFLGGPPPAAPFPECGPGLLAGDPALGCEGVADPCR